MTPSRSPEKTCCRLTDSFLICVDDVLIRPCSEFMTLLKAMLFSQVEESQDWDGVIGRDFLKHRAAKLLAAAARQREREHDSTAGAD